MLIIGGAFGTAPNPGFPRWSFALAQLIVGLVTTAVACALLLAVAAPVYGILRSTPACGRRSRCCLAPLPSSA
jgi:hypothetical protein